MRRAEVAATGAMAAPARQQPARVSLTSVPNLLTLSRVGVIPLFVCTFFMETRWSEALGFLLFTLASITDFLDGYLARAWNQGSAFGRFLDPLADKLLVAAALLMLVYARRITSYSIVAAVIGVVLRVAGK
jgi:cardiolipin synthase